MAVPPPPHPSDDPVASTPEARESRTANRARRRYAERRMRPRLLSWVYGTATPGQGSPTNRATPTRARTSPGPTARIHATASHSAPRRPASRAETAGSRRQASRAARRRRSAGRAPVPLAFPLRQRARLPAIDEATRQPSLSDAVRAWRTWRPRHHGFGDGMPCDLQRHRHFRGSKGA